MGRAFKHSHAPRSANERPGRNDPCWCGSGKKYKKCHLESDARSTGGAAHGAGSAVSGDDPAMTDQLLDFALIEAGTAEREELLSRFETSGDAAMRASTYAFMSSSNSSGPICSS